MWTRSRSFGIVFLLLLAANLTQAQGKRQIAVTFDDLPSSRGGYAEMKAVTENLLAKLAAEKVPTIGFVNEQKLFAFGEIDRRTALLNLWLESGHELGNHSFSHVQIDNVGFDQYAEDLMRGETVTRMLLRERGKTLRYYRHTQLRTGPTEEYRRQLSSFLTKRNYTIAPVTIDNDDYIFAVVYERARSKGDRELQAKIVDAYLTYMDSVFAHFEKLSQDFLGYEVKQTLLLHANEINADHFDKLAQVIRKRGYTFIKLDEALSDKAYQMPEAQSRRGISWIHRWMLAKGLPIKEEPRAQEWINADFQRHLAESR